MRRRMRRPSARAGTSSRSPGSMPVPGRPRSRSGTKAPLRIASLYPDDLRVGLDARRHRHLARRNTRARGAARPLYRALVVVDAEGKEQIGGLRPPPPTPELWGPGGTAPRWQVTFPISRQRLAQIAIARPVGPAV